LRTRLLFVDDEPSVEGFERLLHPLRNEWTMEFVGSARAAQECIVRDHYDVILADVTMAGIDGAQLLAFTREHSPMTVRVAVSARQKQRLAMRCAGIAHLWLPRPCHPDVFRQAIARITDPRFRERTDRVMALAMQWERLPSVPEIYSDMIELLSDPDASLQDVGSLLERDLALTAKALHVANSALFGLAHRVSRPAEAAAFLGIDALKSLVLATDVYSQFAKAMPRGFPAARLSRRSRRVGAAARRIAQLEGGTRELLDEALCAGLLSDVGILVLASNRYSQFQEVVSLELPRGEAERQVFGATHAEVGGYLLGLWGLPPAVVAAVGFHQSPSDSPLDHFCATTAVHVADCLVSDSFSESAAPSLDREYLGRLRLLDRLPVWRSSVDAMPSPDFG
jgi:HD-like signal output (HDOD) protein/CheY-like chemotaxis protein